MTEDPTDLALDAVAESDLTPGVQDVVVAALLGDDALAELLAGTFVAPARTSTATVSAEPQRAYLGAISVRGFRGIGPHSTLKLTPGPGLTLVIGRNGSGKSSFAEALEFLLTGTSLRWTDRKSKEWERGWRNLHTSDTTKLSAEFVVDGRPGKVRVTTEWGADTELGDAMISTRGSSGDEAPDLGWQEVVRSHRPLLSYPELARLAESGPSALYDSMSSILGLEELNQVAERLATCRKHLEGNQRELNRAKATLLSELTGSEDDRANAIRERLEITRPDLDSLSTALDASLGAATGAAEIDSLHTLTRLDPASPEEAAEARDDHSSAAAEVARLAGSAEERSEHRRKLLLEALVMHDQHGDQECPVCGTGRIDNGWRTQAEEEVARLEGEAEAVTRARGALADAARRCEEVASTLPRTLPRQEEVSGIDLSILADVVSRSSGDHDDDPARALDDWDELVAAIALVREQAMARLAELDDQWRPLADEIRAWIVSAREVEASRDRVKEVKAAETWVRGFIEDLRDERFAPIATQVKGIWSQLRQASNVSLDSLSLAGSRTRRRVNLEVSVDGSSAPPLAVMSQGELNALALSLFVPRATLADSPFGFIVIDDPVQAMDPARVDGLASVLADVATTRQVVVFTHDDRLADAVRTLRIEARIIEVRRGDRSEVKPVPGSDPVTRYLDDARAIVRSDGVDEDLVERVVAGLCRQAVEAAAVEIYRTRQLEAGAEHQHIEEVIAASPTFNQRCALALWGDRERAGDVIGHFNKRNRRLGDAAGACARGAHAGPLPVDPRRLPELADELCQVLGRRVDG